MLFIVGNSTFYVLQISEFSEEGSTSLAFPAVGTLSELPSKENLLEVPS